jgi:hypothetical protein
VILLGYKVTIREDHVVNLPTKRLVTYFKPATFQHGLRWSKGKFKRSRILTYQVNPKRILFFKPTSWLGQIRPHFSVSMDAQIPVIVENPLTTYDCRKFQLDPLGDHLNTCTTHSGTKKAHDWMVDQVPDLFRTTHKVKTQHVVKSRGQHCGDIELGDYLTNETGPVSLVLDLRIAYDRVGSITDPNLNGHLKYPNNFDQSLNDAVADKVRKYRTEYNNRPPSVVSFIPAIASTSGRLHSEFVRLLFLQTHRETDRFFAASGVLSAQSDRGFYHYRHPAVSAQVKAKLV